MDLIDRYRAHATASGLAPDTTINDRVELLRRVDRDLPHGLCQANTDELTAWLARTGWSASTRQNYYGHIRAFFAWATNPANPILDFDPSAGLTRPRSSISAPRPAEHDELAQALDRLDEPWRTYVLLAAYGGLRSCEIATVRREDITEDWITVRGKGGKVATVPTHPMIWQAVKALPPGPIARKVRDGAPVNAHYISCRTSQHLTRIGLPTVSLHRFRHWLGTWSLRGGGNLRVTQELLRHSSPATTAIYTQVSEGERRAAIEALPMMMQAAGAAPPLGPPGRHDGSDVPPNRTSEPRVMPIREGGGWVDRRTLLAAMLASIGGAPLAAILPDNPTDPASRLVNGLTDRFLRPGTRPALAERPSPLAVTRALSRVQLGYASSDFQALAKHLPEAIDLAQAYEATARDGDDAAHATTLLSQTYSAAASTCIKVGRLDLAWIGADRAAAAGRRSEDAIAEAEAARQVSILCRKAGRPTDTMTIAAEAAERLYGRGLHSPDHLSLYGLLLLSAGYAAAVAGQRDRCMELFADAEHAAGRLDGGWYNGFGAVNVDIYRVSAEWVLGDAGAGVAYARRVVDAGPLPTAERAERFWVDTARVWQRMGKPVECFRAMLNAERAAPQAVRVRPVVHSVTTWLLSAPSTIGLSGLREFAGRVTAT